MNTIREKDTSYKNEDLLLQIMYKISWTLELMIFATKLRGKKILVKAWFLLLIERKTIRINFTSFLSGDQAAIFQISKQSCN